MLISLRTFVSPRFVLAVCCASLLVGCGSSDGPPRFRLQGSVDFDGKPVPAGSITFEPDAAKGNKGPQGQATIVDGKFDTNQGGLGHVGGPMVVRITGFASLPKPGSDEPVAPLFPEFVDHVELDKREDSRGFLIPKDYAGAPEATGPKAGEP